MNRLHRYALRPALRALLIAGVPSAAIAAPPGATTPDGFEIGALAYRYHYEEPGIMQLEGPKAGLRLAYARTDAAGRSGRLELSAAYGRLRYDSNGTGALSGVPDTSVDARLLVGFDYGPKRGVPLMPYVGLGYRFLYNDLRGTTSTGAVGYRRESTYVYVPAGLTGRWRQLLATVEIDFLLKGQQTTYLGDTGLGLADVQNDQKRGLGGRASLIYDAGRVAFGPWISAWRIADSDLSSPAPGLIGREPKNRTTEAGFELRFRY
jgi:hypothetical protein